MKLYFDDWAINTTDASLAYQYDNLTRTVELVGELPEGYTWDLLLQHEQGINIIPLSPLPSGGYGAALTDEQLSLAGHYTLQIRGTLGEAVRHTNRLLGVYVSPSISGIAQWPQMPTEFAEAENAIRQLNAHPPIPGDNGYWLMWDLTVGEYAESALALPAVSVGPQGETGPQGERGPQGEQGEQGPAGADGYTPVKGTDYFDGLPGKDGKDGAPGAKGEQGERGLQGEKGADGIGVPSGGNTGEVLTKTAGGTAWAEPTGGGGVNADWAQPDANEPDFIKNKPFSADSYTITWDGESGDYFETEYGGKVYKVSELTPSLEDFKAYSYLEVTAVDTVTQEKQMFRQTPSPYMEESTVDVMLIYWHTPYNSSACFVAYKNNAEVFGMVFPTAGIYYTPATNPTGENPIFIYPSLLRYAKEVKPLDRMYIADRLPLPLHYEEGAVLTFKNGEWVAVKQPQTFIWYTMEDVFDDAVSILTIYSNWGDAVVPDEEQSTYHDNHVFIYGTVQNPCRVLSVANSTDGMHKYISFIQTSKTGTAMLKTKEIVFATEPYQWG